MLGEMMMAELGEMHAKVHAENGFGYVPATPDDPWFAVEGRSGYCHDGWYATYLRAYRAACNDLGIILGAVSERAFARFGVRPLSTAT